MASTTPFYWTTYEGQALQWSLIGIGALFLATGVIVLTAYFCYKSGVRAIKPKIFAGRPVFYIPPRKIAPNGPPDREITGGGKVVNEKGEPVKLPLKIPLPVKQPTIHIHHHDENEGDEDCKSRSEIDSNSEKGTAKRKSRKSSAKSEKPMDQAEQPLPLPPGFNPAMFPPHPFFHPFPIPGQLPAPEHPFAPIAMPDCNGVEIAHPNNFMPQLTQSLQGAENVDMFGLPLLMGLSAHNAAITGVSARNDAILQSDIEDDDEIGDVLSAAGYNYNDAESASVISSFSEDENFENELRRIDVATQDGKDVGGGALERIHQVIADDINDVLDGKTAVNIRVGGNSSRKSA